MALMGGQALTATELAVAADIAPSTASSHLAKLSDAHLIRMCKQGRHRYFQIASSEVAQLVETLGLAATAPILTGPKDSALRYSRVCYDHLAGELAVQILQGLLTSEQIVSRDGALLLTEVGQQTFEGLGCDVVALRTGTRALCRPCLDWSVRRNHLGGALGAALLAALYRRRWVTKDIATRVVHFSTRGKSEMRRIFTLGQR